MYYYKTYYTDGTYDVMKTPSRVTIRKPADVCATCYKVERITFFTYYFEQIKALVKYEIFHK